MLSMKIDLLTTTAVVDDAIKFVYENEGTKKNKIGSADVDIFRNSAIDDTIYRLIPARTRIAI
jgi:hypothetical protein